MKCPVSSIVATFLYLDRIDKEGKLLLKDGDVKTIIDDIEKSLDLYIKNVMDYENSITELPNPDIPRFHIMAKHVMSGVNLNTPRGEIIYKDNDKTFEASTKYNSILDLSSTNIEAEDSIQLLKENMISSIALADENIKAYFATNNLEQLKSQLELQIVRYLKEYNLSDSIDGEDLSKLTNIIYTLTVSDGVNSIISSKDSILNELVLDLNDSKVENIISNINQDETLSFYLESIKFDVEHLLSYIVENANKVYKSKMLGLVNLRTQGFKSFNEFFWNNYSRGNEEFLKTIDNAKELDFQLKFSPINNNIGFIFTKKTKEDYSLKYAKIESSKEILTDSLNEKIKVPVVPKIITVDLSGSTTSSSFSVKLDYDEKDVPIAILSSNKSNSTYFYNSNMTDNKIKTVVIDESDSSPKSTVNKLVSDISKTANNTITSTGTGITGKAKSVVPLLAQSGGIENIEEMERKFTELAGVFKIRSSFISLLLKAMVKDSEYSNDLKSLILSVYESKQRKENKDNIQKDIEKYVVSTLKEIKENDDLNKYLDNINYFDSLRAVQKLVNGIIEDKNFYQKNIANSGKKIMEEFIFSMKSDFVREVAGIQAGTLASLIKSEDNTIISITTRENLTGKDEKMNFIDRYTHLDNKNSIYQNELKEDSESIVKNVFAPKIIREYISKTAEIDYTVQVNQILKINFDLFVKAFKDENSTSGKNNLGILTRESGLSKNDFLYHTSKSGTSTKDSIMDLYSEYLINNGKLTQSTLDSISIEAKIAFETSLQVFQDYVIDTLILEKSNKNLEGSYDMPFSAPSELYSMFGENKKLDEVFYAVNGFPYKKKSNSPYVFSIPIALNKKEWSFISEPIKETVSLVNDEFNEIIDNFTSIGKEDLITDAIVNDRKPVIASARVISSVINLYDTIASSSKRENKNEKIMILAVENPATRKAVEKVDKQFLKENNIELTVVDSKKVAIEVAKANSKKTQYAIVSNYVPISRGISLANSDDIIITDALDKMNDAIQFLARGFNPQANILSSDISLHNGGFDMDIGMNFKEDIADIKAVLENVENSLEYYNDGSLLISNTNTTLENYTKDLLLGNSIIRGKITHTDALKDEIYESNRVYKGFTSGTLADTMSTNINNFFVPTKQYSTILSQDKDNNISKNNQIKFV